MKTSTVVVLCAALVLLAIWDGAWKLVAMWKSARHNQLAWYICLAIFNTAGILPILYITLFQPGAGGTRVPPQLGPND